MTLDQYLTTHKLTDEAFAAKAGLSQPHVNRLRRGKSNPSLVAIGRINAASKGQVAPGDWFVSSDQGVAA